MLELANGGKDYHHKHVQVKWANKSLGNPDPYPTLKQASDENPDCYILSSSTDTLWFVCCGKQPIGFGEDELEKWYKDVDVKRRISKDTFEAG